MKVRFFAVRDGKVEQFFPPLCFQTPGEAQRWFGDVVNDGKSNFSKHPSDYALYELGTYESETGLIEPSLVSLVCSGTDVKDVVPEEVLRG